MASNLSHRCSICGKTAAHNPDFAPFCSERCKLIDLGNWSAERYRVAGSVNDEQQPDSPSNEHDDDSATDR